MVLASPAAVLVALMSEAGWAFLAALATFTTGLVIVGRVIAPDASSFHGDTKIWQNDGPPGGGAAGGL